MSSSSIERIQKNRISLEKYKLSHGKKESPTNKLSNDKIIDELSSFIAEFSYLTDTPNKVSEKETTQPAQSYQVYAANTTQPYQVYAANTAGNETHNFNKIYDSGTSESRNDPDSSRRHRKSVEWRDQKKNSPVHRNKHRKRREKDFTDTVNTTSGEEQRTPSKPEKYHKSPRRGRHERNPKWFRSRDKDDHRHSRSRSRSRSRKSKRKKSRSRGRHKPRGFRSDDRELKKTPDRHRQRSKSSKSLVRFWPFRYERKKSRIRKKIKKRAPTIIKKIEVKDLVPTQTETESIITLYPKNTKEKPKLKQICKYDPQFFTNTSLPCKCFKCMRKFESLMKMPVESHDIGDIRENIMHRERIRPEPRIHPYGVGDIRENIMYRERIRPGPCIQPCGIGDIRENNIICREMTRPGPCIQPCGIGDYRENNIICREMTRPGPCIQPCGIGDIRENVCREITRPVPCIHQQTVRCPQTIRTCGPDWYCDDGADPCSSPCDDSEPPEWNGDSYCKQNGMKDSVYFKFDSFGQYISSNITEYFHSILNETIHC